MSAEAPNANNVANKVANEIATGVTLTERAAQHVHRFLDQRDDKVGLRFGARRTGCSGWAYVVDFADAVEKGDKIFEDQGIRIVVDPKSLPMVEGTEIDFVSDGLNQVFRFQNPNVTGECGCGESFAVSA